MMGLLGAAYRNIGPSRTVGQYLARYYDSYSIVGKRIKVRFIREDHRTRLLRSGWELSFE